MPTSSSHEVKDAVDRARSECLIQFRKYIRRFTDEAGVEIQRRYALDPTANPDEVGLEVFHAIAADWGIIEPPQKAINAISSAN